MSLALFAGVGRDLTIFFGLLGTGALVVALPFIRPARLSRIESALPLLPLVAGAVLAAAGSRDASIIGLFTAAAAALNALPILLRALVRL